MSWPDNWTQFGIVEGIEPFSVWISRTKNYGGTREEWLKLRAKNDIQRVVEISDTQRYKMCGNGVVSKVVEAIIERL